MRADFARTALLSLLLLACAAPARASLTLCNRTSYILYAATAAADTAGSETHGWTRIAPGDCQAARTEALTAQSYFVYARSGLSHSGPARAWGGNLPICVKDANFVLRQAAAGAACTADDQFSLPFAALDTHGKPNWSMTFDENPAFASLTAAQLAGVKRLLADNGYKLGAIDARPDKRTGAALAAFRQRMHFSPQAGNADLFNALEVQAMKTAAPAGYTVCNDTRALLLVALAQIAGGKATQHGWWKIPAGACAKAITTPLASGTVWLLAQKANGAVVAGGAEKFCVAAVEFDIQDRGSCAARGFSETGFARTDTGHRAGYIARIGEHGLK